MYLMIMECNHSLCGKMETVKLYTGCNLALMDCYQTMCIKPVERLRKGALCKLYMKRNA